MLKALLGLTQSNFFRLAIILNFSQVHWIITSGCHTTNIFPLVEVFVLISNSDLLLSHYRHHYHHFIGINCKRSDRFLPGTYVR